MVGIVNPMQTSAMNKTNIVAAANESALQVQIGAMRESLKNQRERARKMWNDCAAESTQQSGEARLALGQFTAKLLKRKVDEHCD